MLKNVRPKMHPPKSIGHALMIQPSWIPGQLQHHCRGGAAGCFALWKAKAHEENRRDVGNCWDVSTRKQVGLSLNLHFEGLLAPRPPGFWELSCVGGGLPWSSIFNRESCESIKSLIFYNGPIYKMT